MAAFAHLLVAVDGGDLTEAVTAYAFRVADGAAVDFVCAVDAPAFAADAELRTARKVVDACVAAARAEGIDARGHVVEEPPVDAILHTAAGVNADVIVMASHGRSGFARAVLGSVAEGVARRARTAVLFVPSGLSESDPSRHLHQIFQGL